MIYLNENDLIKCLDLDRLQSYMKDALVSFSLKQSRNFSRTVFQTNDDHNAALGYMPAMDCNRKILGYKAISVFNQNAKKNINPHQGIVTLLDPVTGKIKCMLDGSFITAVRTAAVSAVASELLSRPDSQTLALIGAGCQAIAHVKAISRIRPIKNIRIFSRTKTSFEAFCKHFPDEPFKITHYLSPQEAVSCSDIVVTCTPSITSLLTIEDFSKGTHVNAVGACRPSYKEVTLFNHNLLKIYLDSQKDCLIESDEIIHPLMNKTLSENTIIGELGSCIAQQIPGRSSADDITFFKSVGLSIEDIYAAEFFFHQAEKNKIGQWIEA